jgi:signal transduction histidine kinase
MLSWPFFAVVAVVLGIAVLVEPHTLARRATTVAAVGVLMAVLHAISRTGRVVLASWMLVIGLSVIVTQRAWMDGGIHAPVAVFYALFIVMAGVLVGVRGGVVTAAVCTAGAVALTAGAWFDWLAVPLGAGSPIGALVFVLLAIGLGLVLQALVAFRPRRESMGAGAVQMLVHDMRSPMQVLIAQLDQLREDVRGEGAKGVEAAMDGAAALHRMTNSLLDVSRFEHGQMPVQKSDTDLVALVRSVIDAIRILQPARNFVVEAGPAVICHCDPELTRRVMENLLSNAMKHSPVDGRVLVTISTTRTRATVAVHDEGPGVPPEERSRIFEPFSAEGLRTAAGYSSSGLGLAFCRLAIEAQGGKIRVEDGLQRGSVFIVELPCR